MGRRQKARKQAQNAQTIQAEPQAAARLEEAAPTRDAPRRVEGGLIKFPSRYRGSGVEYKVQPETAANPGKWIYPSIPPEKDVPAHIVSVMNCWERITRELYDAIPGFPLPFDTPTPPVHSVAPVDGAGLGLFAAADFNIGDTILCERPLLVLSLQAPSELRAASLGEELARLDAAVTSMRPENVAKFLSLRNCKGPPFTEMSGRVSTNAFAIELFPEYGDMFGAVARDLSRANHSCAPNSHVDWDMKTFSFTMRASATIRAGEQIFVSYLGFKELLQLRKDRRAELLRKYNFVCECSACGPTGAHASDKFMLNDGRRTYFQLYGEGYTTTERAVFARWLKDGAPRPSAYEAKRDYDGLALICAQAEERNAHVRALRAWRQVEKEGYVPMWLWTRALEMLCKTSAVLQEAALVRKYATLASLYGLVYFDQEDNGWRAVAEAPERSEWWGKARARKALEEEEAAVAAARQR